MLVVCYFVLTGVDENTHNRHYRWCSCKNITSSTVTTTTITTTTTTTNVITITTTIIITTTKGKAIPIQAYYSYSFPGG